MIINIEHRHHHEDERLDNMGRRMKRDNAMMMRARKTN